MTTTAGRVTSKAVTIPLDTARKELVDRVLGASVVQARLHEDKPASSIVDAFVEGLGSEAEGILSAHLDRAAARLVATITAEQREFVTKPQYENVVTVENFAPVRFGKPTVSSDRTGAFARSVGYVGWQRSLYDQVWFDSGTERQLGLILDDAAEVEVWARLHTGDLKILWTGDDTHYNPDFVVVEKDSTHWVVESKMNKEMESLDVKGKKNAALRWVNHVSKDPSVGATWRYLLASEADIETVHGSWAALKKLAATT